MRRDGRYKPRSQYAIERRQFFDGIKSSPLPDNLQAGENSPPSITPSIKRPSLLHVAINRSPENPTLLVEEIQKSAAKESFDNDLRTPKNDLIIFARKKIFISHKMLLMSCMVCLFLVSMFTVFRLLKGPSLDFVEVRGTKSESKKDDAYSVEEVLSSNLELDEGVVRADVIARYSVIEKLPRFLEIPGIVEGKARTLRMSINNKGAMECPSNIYDAGWYEASASPEDRTGATLIVGHVSGPTEPGLFYDLYRMQKGNTIVVETGNGVRHIYRVVAKEELANDDNEIGKLLESKESTKPGLTLMTCSGEFNPETQQYENRLAVFAVRDN